MADQELDIQISPTGQVTIKTRGVKGPACMDIADAFVRILGREEERQKTAEYYEAEQSIQHRIDVKQRR